MVLTHEARVKAAKAEARKYLDKFGVEGAIRNLGLRMSKAKLADEGLYWVECVAPGLDTVGSGKGETAGKARARAVRDALMQHELVMLGHYDR